MKEPSSIDDKAILVSIGKHIRAQRLLKDWSIETLAAHADVSANFLGQVERGESNPSFEIFFKLAAGLEVDPTIIFRGIKADVYPMIEEYINRNRPV